MAALVAAVLVCGACSSSSPDDLQLGSDSSVSSSSSSSTSSSTTSTSTTTTTAPPTTETTEPEPADFPDPEDGEIFDEYIAEQLEAFRFELRTAAQNPTATPEVDYPNIARFAAGEMLSGSHGFIRDFANAGEALREPEESAVGRTIDEKYRISGVATLDGVTLTVFECVVDDEDVVDVATGAVKISGVLTLLTVVTMQRFDDGWKVVESEVRQTLEGVDGCYLASDAEFPY